MSTIQDVKNSPDSDEHERIAYVEREAEKHFDVHLEDFVSLRKQSEMTFAFVIVVASGVLGYVLNLLLEWPLPSVSGKPDTGGHGQTRSVGSGTGRRLSTSPLITGNALELPFTGQVRQRRERQRRSTTNAEQAGRLPSI